MQIRDTMRSVMGLPLEAVMEYKKHTDSMRDNSSYRNANANFGEKGEAHAAREPREPREPREARPQREG